jgi:signal transduction histidine kinase
VAAVVNNLMDFSRAPGDQKSLVQVTAIIDHALELADGIIADSHGLAFSSITVLRHYDKGLPPVKCFSAELQQVFLSLFRHACFALAEKMAHGGDQRKPTITIEVNERYDSLWIKVQHNGRGLSAQEQRDIFEPFFSSTINGYDVEAENRLSFPYFIITEYHHGEMAVTSDEEIGSTFHIQLQL